MNQDELIKAGLVHSVHNSETKSFGGCRRRWDWAYRDGYYPLVTPRPLEFGTAWHAAKEVWYDPDMWRKDRELQAKLARLKFKDVTRQQYANYVELNGEPDSEILADYTDRVQLGLRMVDYYTQQVSPKLDAGLTPIAVEIAGELPLDMWCRCDRCRKRYIKWIEENRGGWGWVNLPMFGSGGSGNDPDAWYSQPDPRKAWHIRHVWQGLPVTFGFRIDAVFTDLEGRMLVVDWKTAARIMDDETEWAFLDLDNQIGRYCMALHRLGRPADGFIYHEQKRAVPDKPERLTRLYKGRMFSTDKSANVDFDTFVKTVSEEDPGYHHGVYDDYIKFLKSPDAPRFYQRHRIYKKEYELNQIYHNLVAQVRDILEDPRVYPEPSRFQCNRCAYRVPCGGKNRGEDYQYALETMFVKKELRYYEEPR